MGKNKKFHINLSLEANDLHAPNLDMSRRILKSTPGRGSLELTVLFRSVVFQEGDEVDIMFTKIKPLEEELKQARLQESQVQEKERLTRQLYSFRGIEQGEDQ